MQEASVLQTTPLFADTDPMSEPIMKLPAGITVSVLETGKHWMKIHYMGQTGYVVRGDLCILSDKVSNIMISIPKEHANSLYEALKFALKK